MKFCLISLAAMLGLFTMPLMAGAGEVPAGWQGSAFAGYNRSKGNTNQSTAHLELEASRRSGNWGCLLRGNMSYSENNHSMDGQKWDALGRFAFDFGRARRWFSFYQLLADHDYFADIDYRLTPSSGLGYHVANSESWQWDVDAGLGYRVERHRINQAADDEYWTAVVHTGMKRRVLERAFFSEEIAVYPGMEHAAATTLRAESAFSNPLTKALDLELKYILDYNTDPAEGKKRSDTQIIAGLKYKF